MSVKADILQSNHIPWTSYFDLTKSVDLFILDNDIQAVFYIIIYV